MTLFLDHINNSVHAAICSHMYSHHAAVPDASVGALLVPPAPSAKPGRLRRFISPGALADLVSSIVMEHDPSRFTATTNKGPESYMAYVACVSQLRRNHVLHTVSSATRTPWSRCQ